MAKYSFLILLAVGLLMACGPATVTNLTPSVAIENPTGSIVMSPSPSAPDEATPSPQPLTPTPLVGQTVGPTSVGVVGATETLAPIATLPEPSSVINVTQKCLTVGAAVPLQTVAAEGTVVMWPLEPPEYLLDLKTGAHFPLPYSAEGDVIPLGMAVSPDRNYLAYVNGVRNQAREVIRQPLWVVTADGHVLAKGAFKNVWRGWRWLDNERLEVDVDQAPSGTKVILNPFTGEWQELAPALPNLYNDYHQGIARSYWTVQYSPDLEWAVYLSNPSTETDYAPGVVVWDLVAQQAVWQKTGAYAAFSPPAWSPSRQQVAAVIDGAIFLLNRTGLVTALAGPQELANVRTVHWSPDERYLAYWTYRPGFGQDPYQARLFVYDMDTHQVRDYCLDNAGYSVSTSDVAWSPDSQQFVIMGVVVQADGSIFDHPVLVDLVRETAVQISETTFSGLWLRSKSK